MKAGGADREAIAWILAELERRRPKRGRRPENDSAKVLREILRISDEKGISLNAAAALIAEGYPPHQREAARKRLARKAKEQERAIRAEIAEAEKESEARRFRAVLALKPHD